MVGCLVRKRQARSKVEDAGRVQLTNGRQCRLPPAIGAQSADPRVLVGQPCDIQAGRAHSFGHNVSVMRLLDRGP
jgi:hypothetical protein